MSTVDIEIAMIETPSQKLPYGPLKADNNQDVASLKMDIKTWYNLPQVTTQWALVLGQGQKLDNNSFLRIYGLTNGTTLCLQDPELVYVSWTQGNAPMGYWVKRASTIAQLKQTAFGASATSYSFRRQNNNNVNIPDTWKISDLVGLSEDKIYLNLVSATNGG